MHIFLLRHIRVGRWGAFLGAGLFLLLWSAAAMGQQPADAGLAALQQAAAEDPQDAAALKALAFAYRHQDRHCEAIPLLTRVIELTPDDEEARLTLAQSLTWTKRYAEAATQYRGLLDRHPGDETLTRSLAQVLVWDKRPGAAAPLWRKLVRRNGPTSPDALELGKALAWAGETEEAIEVLQRYVDAHPEDVEARLQLAYAYRYAEAWPEAETGYRRVLQEQPGGPGAVAGLALVGQEIRPLLSAEGLNLDDSDGVQVDSVGALHRWNTDASHRYYVGAMYRRISQPGVGRFVSYPLTLGAEFSLPVRRRIGVEYTYHDYRPVKAQHGLALVYEQDRPAAVSFTVRAQHQPVWDYAKAVAASVEVNSLSADVWRDFSARWRGVASAAVARYTDAVSRQTYGVLVAYRLRKKPGELELRYRFGFDDTSRQSAFYYSPNALRVNSLGVYLNQDVTPKFSYGGEVAAAQSQERGFNTLDSTNVWAYANYRVNSEAKLRLQYTRWRSASYSRHWTQLGVEVGF